jgi:capsid protein
MIKWLNKKFETFGRYAAAEPSTRRRDPGTRIKSSDNILTDSKRRRVMEGARDLYRNFSVAAWAIRKHLDYVSSFTFQAMTSDPVFNDELENLMTWYSRPLNCDAAGRHSLRKIIRLAEARRVIDGDMFFVKLNDGRLQAIESDRVRDPGNSREDNADYVHGVRVGPGGQLRSIAIHKRLKSGGYEFERNVRAGNFIQLAYNDAFDQIRGVSPLASAIAPFQDSLEIKDLTLAKAKVHSLFALSITREMADLDDDGDGETDYSIDFGKGPVQLDLDPGDKAEFLESKHPSTEFQQFMLSTLQSALKSLDIPWSMFDESYANYSGARAAIQGYLMTVKSKREDLREILNRITAWRLQKFITRGVLTLPAGMTFSDLRWEWIPAGQPWWEPAKEVEGDIAAINAGLRTRSEIRRERYGDDWKSVIKKQAEEREFMNDLAGDVPADNGNLQDLINAYGVGVRAGTITPQKGDEEHFRKQLGLPVAELDVNEVWTDEPTRRPITLVKPGDPMAEEIPQEAESNER